MAHEISIRESGLAEMAWAVETPWHGLGQQVNPDASVDEWQAAAGLDWNIQRAPVQYMNGEMHTFAEKHVLYRSDNADALSVVSDKYQIVQPHDVLDFFRDLVGAGGFKINTAGALRGGRRIWALAEIGEQAKVVGDDMVGGYLLLATSCDGGLATTAQFTSIRVVCANTLAMADRESGRSKISIPHSTKFNAAEAKAALGIAANSFDEFMLRSRALAAKPVDLDTADRFLANLLNKPEPGFDVRKSRGFKAVLGLFNGDGMGAQMDGARGTAWGLVNAVTEYFDHKKPTRTDDARLDSAWFGSSSRIKAAAFDLAMTI
jgi:phage/plasmid-like protein (TIGR03299 family)